VNALTGKISLADFENFTKRAVLSQNLAQVVLEVRGVPRSTQQRWLDEVDAFLHKSVLDSLYSTVLPEDNFIASRDMVEWALKQVPVLRLLIQEHEVIEEGS
jgi:hypothetical protein